MPTRSKPPVLTLEAFFEWAETVSEPVDLRRGYVIYPEAAGGETANHAEISAALSSICYHALSGQQGRFLGNDATVAIAGPGSTYHPDGLIACPPNYVSRPLAAIDNPQVIFEILSPKTREFDRTEKFDDYMQIESLQDYVLISADQVRVEVLSRTEPAAWTLRVYGPDTVAYLPSLNIHLPTNELYAFAEFEPETTPEPAR